MEKKKIKMKASVYRKYGSSKVLNIEEIDRPKPKDNEILVKVHATSIQFADWAFLSGKPYFMRIFTGIFKPRQKILGSDISGKVVAIGNDVNKFKLDDEVFADISDCGRGGFAEYVTVPEEILTLKPKNMTFEEAAAVPQAAIVALQGLRDKGEIKKGQEVLINGASGGIGTYAIQLAKYFGCEVTGVCSTKNMDMVRSLGADHVIDYSKENFTESEKKYDLVFDIVANHSASEFLQVLKPTGFYVAGAFNPSNLFKFSKKIRTLLAKSDAKDLLFIRDLIEKNHLSSIIDNQYTLKDLPKALNYYGKRHSKGKVIIQI